MPKPMTEQSAETRLLTLINVSSAKPTKRVRSIQRDWQQIARKALKSTKHQNAGSAALGVQAAGEIRSDSDLARAGNSDDEDAVQHSKVDNSVKSSFDLHWSADSTLVQDKTVQDVQSATWSKSKAIVPGLGSVRQFQLKGSAQDQEQDLSIYTTRLMDKYKEQISAFPSSATSTNSWFLETLASYKDIFFPRVELATHSPIRSALALHAMNHVYKNRSRVLKNNDHLAKLADSSAKGNDPDARDTRDQGFTRPKVLILAPLRNSALAWIRQLAAISQADTVENLTRFENEYALPEGAVDKLVERQDEYPADHVATFSGNIDDSFRVGVKVTRKTVKLFSEFYQADVIVASPLGLRTSIEKENDSDFLSSIELLIVDQMDVMTMQNWDHVQFVMDRLNTLPQEAHGADFSRIKPWYLDAKSALLRQSVLLSAYETPEMRNLFSKQLINVAGKIHAGLDVRHEGVLARVPRGIKQVFSRFECVDVHAEDDARFEWFTTKTLPMLRKSAVSSSQTLIFVPSYFDFVRLKRYMKKLDDFNFLSISEYTPTPDVSRVRGAFFAGKANFLLLTERFHFFRRYRIRGAKTFVFYGLPDHAVYYPEVVSFPFARPGSLTSASFGEEEPDIDESELSAQVIFSRFDLLKLARVVGTEDANRMVESGAEASRFTFLD